MRRILVAIAVVGMLAGCAIPVDCDDCKERSAKANGSAFITIDWSADISDTILAAGVLGTEDPVIAGERYPIQTPVQGQIAWTDGAGIYLRDVDIDTPESGMEIWAYFLGPERAWSLHVIAE